MKNPFFSFLILSLALPVSFPTATLASVDETPGFDPGFVISNEELLDKDSMTQPQIQEFLEEQPGTLSEYFTQDVDGHLKLASMIIHDAAHRHNINPKIGLLLVQKEQGLLKDDTPKDTQYRWATGYAVCDSCDVDDPRVARFGGFAKQINSAFAQKAYYYTHPHEYFYQVGGTYQFGDQTVHIKNLATAGLYNYTPHYGANKLFWRLWKGLFGGAITHPDGTLIKNPNEPAVWLVQEGRIHLFDNLQALNSRYDINRIVPVTSTTIDSYEKGPSIGYAKFSLVQDQFDQIYMLTQHGKRLIDETAMLALGFLPDEIETVDAATLAYFKTEPPITTETLSPFGALLQDPESFGVYYVKDGIKYPLIAPELLELNFSGQTVRQSSTEELAKYAKGSPITLFDGALVKGLEDPTVYVISNGKRLAITSEYTFISLGYDWLQIKTVSDKLLALHPLGPEISIDTEVSEDDLADLTESLE